MKQPFIQTPGAALTIGGKAVDGATLHAAGLGITRHTAAAITADRNALIAQRTAYEAAKTALALERAARDAATVSTRGFVVLTRDMLKPHFGSQHNASWTAAGFVNSLVVPATPDKVILLVESLSEFLTGRPDLENAALNITAAQADTVTANLLAAQNSVKNKEVVAKNALALRNTKYLALRKRLRDLIKDLGQVIDPLDNRWLDFGLNRPGQLVTPAVPGKVSVAVNGNSATVKWQASARAQYYRVWKKVIGVDEDYSPVGSPTDLDFAMEDLPAGTQIEIVVSAVNSGGESQKSQKVTITVAA